MDNITLDIFISTLFPDLDAGERVCMARPANKGYHQYEYSPRLAQTIAQHPDAWYVNVSSVKAPPEGKHIRRRKIDCTAVWVLMLDDVGTKAKAPDLPPSIILETSKDNYQWLYLLEPHDVTTPEGLAYFEGCNKAVTAAGYGDKGAGGVTRVFRVPGSINTKEGKDNWPTVVTDWHPERIYALDDIMTSLNLKPEIKPVKEIEAAPAGLDDTVAQWLESKDLLGEPDEAFYKIRCPWSAAHTDDQISAGYSPLGHGLLPLYRVFNCFHEHCADKGAEHFLAWVTQQGGPRARVSGVSEVEAAQLNEYVEALNPIERSELLRHSLPPVRKSDLFDVDLTPGGKHAKAQPVTGMNVARVADVLGIVVQRNMQTHEMECEFLDDSLNALVANADAEALSLLFDHCDLVGMKNVRAIGERIVLMSNRVKYSPVVDWVRATRWDEVPRFDDLLATVPVAPMYEKVWPTYLRRWLIQTMQAMHNWQGQAKVIDHVLVLCSKAQGTGKTTWVERLLPSEFITLGVHLNIGQNVSGDRDSIRKATRTPIVELGELETTFSKTAVGHKKSFLSLRHDTYRIAYAPSEVMFPRTTSYIGTVNQIDFLVDSTGSRRYWPVDLIPGKRCDIYHKIDIQQLWAEVYTWWRDGEIFVLSDDEDAVRERLANNFQYVTPVVEMVAQYLARHNDTSTEPMNTTTFLTDRLHIAVNNANKRECKNILESMLGPARILKGIRNAWAIPMLEKPQPHIKLAAKQEESTNERP